MRLAYRHRAEELELLAVVPVLLDFEPLYLIQGHIQDQDLTEQADLLILRLQLLILLRHAAYLGASVHSHPSNDVLLLF